MLICDHFLPNNFSSDIFPELFSHFSHFLLLLQRAIVKSPFLIFHILSKAASFIFSSYLLSLVTAVALLCISPSLGFLNLCEEDCTLCSSESLSEIPVSITNMINSHILGSHSQGYIILMAQTSWWCSEEPKTSLPQIFPSCHRSLRSSHVITLSTAKLATTLLFLILKILNNADLNSWRILLMNVWFF